MAMKISVKISKKGVESLQLVLQNLNEIRSVTREERTNKSILEEIAKKVYLMRCNFTSDNPKKFNLNFYQASVLEYWLRSILSTVSMNDNECYAQLHKIANDLHQKII